jgi:glycosyltransferase involved in cell wall biosynthesis
MGKKIKIIYVIDGLIIGGAQVFLVDLIELLNKNLFDIKVVTIIEKGILAEELEKIGIEVVHLQKKGRLGLWLVLQLIKFLRREKPDIVHTHLFGGDTWGRTAAILARVPVIISTEHNTNLDEGWTKRKVKKFFSFFTKKIVAVSEAVRNYSVAVDHIKAKKITVIPNGIDISQFADITEKKFSNPPVIGVIGRLEPQKGHEYLFEALNLIKAIPWVLWVVGDGSLKNELERLAKDLSLRERIIFLGARKNIPEILSQVDIFVMPSLWEGLGLALLEAAAAGKPVVASRVGGVPEIIENGKTGILVEAKNVKSLADGLEHVLLGENEAAEMGQRARAAVAEKFSAGKMIGLYEKLYKNILLAG